MLASTCLLTLMGTGGSGKTRLACEVAYRIGNRYPDGIRLVELATLSDGALVPEAVASVLGVREEPGRTLAETLVSFLEQRKVLMVLDNCEHLVEDCALLANTLLQACPDLRIIATSRQALGLDCEATYRVPSLVMPDPDNLPSIEQLGQYEAVQLFLDRARFRRADFSLTESNAASVVQLCRRLDGIPLAIELAAARVKVLSVAQIVERLDERFRLLSSSSPTVLTRHKTLKATMDWSYSLLSEQERALLRSLSVFAGTFTLESVEEVCETELTKAELLDLLSQLVDKSLVIVETGDRAARYHLLETIRHYAGEIAEEKGELSHVRTNHLRWYMQFAERTEDELLSKHQALWLERLEAEHDNLRAALTWGRTGSTPEVAEMGLRLAGALVWFWYFRGYLSEGRGWLEATLALDTERNTVARAKALNAAGALAYLQSDFAASRPRLVESLQIWRELGDKRGTAFALMFLGRLGVRQGDTGGRRLGEESVRLFREIGDKWGLALALDFLGEVSQERGNSAEANAHHDESLAIYSEIGHNWGVALELSHFGRVALRQGDYTVARMKLEEALRIQREVGDKWMLAWTLHNLGNAVLYLGEYRQAEDLYRESYALFKELGDRNALAGALLMLGYAEQLKGSYEEATALLSEARGLFRELGDRASSAVVHSRLGSTAQGQGKMSEALALHREALLLARTAADRETTAICLEGIAGLFSARQQAARAVELYGACEAIREEAQTPLPPPELKVRRANIEQARTELGDRALDSLLQKGRTLSLSDAIALALRNTAEPSEQPAGESKRGSASALPHGDTTDLSPRELEVLCLIADGLTDAQMGNQLNLSMRTVQAHCRSLYSKLGIASRSAATRYAIEHGLV